MTGYTLIIIRDQIRHIAEVGLEVHLCFCGGGEKEEGSRRRAVENKRSEPTGPGKQGACGKENKLSTIASSYTVLWCNFY